MVVLTALMSKRRDESLGVGKPRVHGLRTSVASTIVIMNATSQVDGRESRLNRPIWIVSRNFWVNERREGRGTASVESSLFELGLP